VKIIIVLGKKIYCVQDSRQQLGFVDSSLSRLDDNTSRKFEAWKTMNGLILSWIIHSIEKPIALSASTIMYKDSAFVAWSDLKERYETGNRPHAHRIYIKLDMSFIICIRK